MKYYIIAGEASGDLHASNLMYAIKDNDPEAEFRCWGGNLMENAGGELVRHYRDLAFMGFVEVVKNLSTVLDNLSFCKKDILQYQPDAIILVDYPGFNLRIAEFAYKKGLKVIYYISPQVWAWKRSRMKKIKRIVDRMIVILPFEKEFYNKYDINVDFVGHPLLDSLSTDIPTTKEVFLKTYELENKPIIALLPGSRKQEVGKMLKIMLEVVTEFKDYQFVVAGTSTIPDSLYCQIINKSPVHLILDKTRDILYNADAALVTSGTATLETALIGTPQVVCYTAGGLSYAIAKRIVHVNHISLVNIILDKPVVKELIQNDLTKENLIQELEQLLYNAGSVKQIQSDYQQLKEELGQSGASRRAATIILKTLKN